MAEKCPGDTDVPRSLWEAIERAICARLRERALGKTICPSEVARDIWPAPNWRDHMGDVRHVAAGMVARGRLAATQRGKPVDPLTATGPIRLGWFEPPTGGD